jgi:ABC-type branched-subunit amino acid transport system ATPase component
MANALAADSVASGTEVLDAYDVSKAFGGMQAVDGVSLSLRAGEVTGLIGANGAGKSTFINVLSGNLKPDHGRIRFRGRDITHAPSHIRTRRGLARTFQHPRLVPNLNCFENVMLGAEARSAGWKDLFTFLGRSRVERAAMERAAESLRHVHLDEAKWGMRPPQLSPADWLWTEIARALAARPVALMLDEPSTGFTGAETEDLITVLKHVAEDANLAVLIVTHDVTLAMRVSRTVVVMHEGRRIAEGSPETIVRDPDVIAGYLGKRGHDLALRALSPAHTEIAAPPVGGSAR